MSNTPIHPPTPASHATHAALQAEIDRLRLQVNTLKVEDRSTNITIGNYLLTRLEQLGVKSMFGVPGDFNLGFLDLVEDHPTIDWIGNCNELNASYAADGYARVKEHSIGVVLTTFGVGELSAANGIAGAFSEQVPVLHIAGVPSTSQQALKPMLHHTLGDGRYDAYEKVAEQFTITQGEITSIANAASEIDRVLTECITKARPVYLMLPTNLVFSEIDSSRLNTPLSRLQAPNDPHAEKFVISEIVKLVKEAQSTPPLGDCGQDVIVLVDACAIRHDTKKEIAALLKATGFPVYASPMGKTAVDEEYELYGGIYVGSISRPAIKEVVETAKLIISVGSLKSDFNTGNFTYSIPTSSTVELHSTSTNIAYAEYPNIGMKELLPKLTKALAPLKPAKPPCAAVTHFASPVPDEGTSPTISQAWFWPRVGKFFRPHDIVVAETGTSSFGILDVPLPNGAIFLAQILWGSIGWTVGSTLGAALAAREKRLGRTILFVGDGSLQLTVQELSTMLKTGVKPIIFVLNNSGYTIERFLHGKERKYNDINNWSWTKLFSVLGDPNGELSSSYTVNNKDELSALLDDEKFANAEKIQLVEVMMLKHDAPAALMQQALLSGKTNAYVAPGSTAV